MRLVFLVAGLCFAGLARADAQDLQTLRNSYPWIRFEGPLDLEGRSPQRRQMVARGFPLEPVAGMIADALAVLPEALTGSINSIALVELAEAGSKGWTEPRTGNILLGLNSLCGSTPPDGCLAEPDTPARRALFIPNLQHESAHAYLALVDATLKFRVGAADGRALWINPVAREAARRAIARYNLKEGIDLFSRIQSSAQKAKVVEWGYDGSRPANIEAAGGGEEASTRAREQAWANGFAYLYGSTGQYEDMATYVERSYYPPGEGRLRFCQQFAELATQPEPAPTGSLVLAFTKINVLRGMGFLSEEVYRRCVGTKNPLSSPSPGIHFSVSRKAKYQVFARNLRGGWKGWGGREYFVAEADGGRYRFEVLFADAKQQPLGFHRLEEFRVGDEAGRTGDIVRIRFLDERNQNFNLRLYARSGVVAVTDLTIENKNLVEARGVILDLQLQTAFGKVEGPLVSLSSFLTVRAEQ